MGAREFSFILISIKWRKKLQKSVHVHTVQISSQSHIHGYLLKSRCIMSFEWFVGHVHLWSLLPPMLYFVVSINDAIFLFITVISVHFLNLKIRKWLLLVFNGDNICLLSIAYLAILTKIGTVYRAGLLVLVIFKLYTNKNLVYDYKENPLG